MCEDQVAFMEELGLKTKVKLDTHVGQDVVRGKIYWLVHELFEASEELKHKPWRRNPPHFTKKDREKFVLEIVDAWHFFLELCIVCGISPEELYSTYKYKMQVNRERQRDGY